VLVGQIAKDSRSQRILDAELRASTGLGYATTIH
jgi:hypothetical protein